MILPRRIEIRHRRLGRLHVFTADDVPGLHVASSDLRNAYDLIEPVAGEIVRRMTGIGVRYTLDESFSGFFTRGQLSALMRPGAAPKIESKLAGMRYVTKLRLLHALHELGTTEVGKRDKRASYWRAASGMIFSVMAPEQRNQRGELLYSEDYARDLIARLKSIDAPREAHEAHEAGPAAEPDLTLHMMPL